MASGKKPIVIPAFGSWLENLRQGRSRATIARLVKKCGVDMDESTLANYEAGRVLAPDPGSLWALAHVYQVDHSEVVARLIQNRNDRELAELRPARRIARTVLDDVEQSCLDHFRTLSTSDQQEVHHLLEFKASRHLGNAAPKKRGQRVAQKHKQAS